MPTVTKFALMSNTHARIPFACESVCPLVPLVQMLKEVVNLLPLVQMVKRVVDLINIGELHLINDKES